MKDEKTLELNKIPSPTWSWLKLNSTHLSISDLKEPILKNGKIQDDEKIKNEGIIIEEKTEDFSSIDKAFSLSKDLSTADGDALPIFGKNESSFLNITVPEGKKVSFPVVIDCTLENCSSGEKSSLCEGENISFFLSLQKIQCKKNSESSFVIVSENKGDNAFQILKTAIEAEEGAKVNVLKIQILGDKDIQIDQSLLSEEETSSITLNHLLLGAGKTFLEVKNTLKGWKSYFNSDLSYVARKEQEYDFNYIVNHFGKNTECKMYAEGALYGNSKKTYRGTIDFKNGCAGSVGEETENTLILSEKAVNKSIPVILCDEEDVQGEHGASIGRLSEEMLFYMEARGFSKKEAEKEAARAKLQRIASKISDEKLSEKVSDKIEEIFKEEL